MLAAMYWPHEEVENAIAIAHLESAFYTAAHNTNGEDSRGLWQINVVPQAHPELALWNLFDPMVNAYFAYNIWRESSWYPWRNSAKKLGLLK